MVLSDRPLFVVSVDGVDISTLLESRLVSVQVVDAPGVQSDNCEIVLEDFDPALRLAIPPTGAEMRIALGSTRTGMRDMGEFVADSVEIGGPPDIMRIRGTAAAHGATSSGRPPITSQKSRSWEAGILFGDLAAKVASDNGMRAVIPASVQDIVLPHIDQVDESDINLLTRLARDVDCIVKPAGARLVVARIGESASASNEPLPRVTLRASDVTNWRAQIKLKPPAGMVVATYRDVDANMDKQIAVGDGAPLRMLRSRASSADYAKAMADAELRRSRRAGMDVSLNLPGRPDLRADGYATLIGFRDGIDGDWRVSRVTHILDAGGFRTSADLEPVDVSTLARREIQPGLAAALPSPPTPTPLPPERAFTSGFSTGFS